jgi:hypothetical protein
LPKPWACGEASLRKPCGPSAHSPTNLSSLKVQRKRKKLKIPRSFHLFLKRKIKNHKKKEK